MPDDDARVLFELFDESTGRGSAPAEPAPALPASKTFRAPAPDDCTTHVARNLDHAKFWALVVDALERIGEPEA